MCRRYKEPEMKYLLCTLFGHKLRMTEAKVLRCSRCKQPWSPFTTSQLMRRDQTWNR